MPDFPGQIRRAADDSVVLSQPPRNVDYLSHDWREEEIWSSWKFIISRRPTFDNKTRLENAAWRSWTKARNKLKTISPDCLNWLVASGSSCCAGLAKTFPRLKDSDVTWLYGPFQTGSDHSMQMTSSSSIRSSCVSKSSSSPRKKPILKKQRHLSDNASKILSCLRRF